MLFSMLLTLLYGALESSMTLVWSSDKYIEIHFLYYFINVCIGDYLIHITN